MTINKKYIIRGGAKMFCPNCGKENPEGANNCGNCGMSLHGNQQSAITGGEQKSKLVAGLLGVFLGAWGIHNFYLGNISRGVIQIFATICSCGIGGLWGFIEGILILCGKIDKDAKGNLLKE